MDYQIICYLKKKQQKLQINYQMYLKKKKNILQDINLIKQKKKLKNCFML